MVAVVSASRVLAPRLEPVFETMPLTVDALSGTDLHRGLLGALLVTASAWTAASVGLSRRAARDDDVLLAYLGHSATLAAAAFIVYARLPSLLTEMLHGGDLLLLVAIVTLLYGSVRYATRTEELLVRSAVTSERQRVAGELRAGVAQELALMAVQTERISGSSEQADALVRSVERALVESSGAIASLGRPVDEPLADAVAHAARDAADRLGVQLHLRVDDHAVATRESREALVRITREALVVAVRHGGATSVSVELQAGRRPTLRILHDGPRPISWDVTEADAIATRALRERAAAIGGSLRPVSSAAGERGLEVQLS
jgi:signal transduction histidine kinase